jgi:RNA polymerase primary sigma factor
MKQPKKKPGSQPARQGRASESTARHSGPGAYEQGRGRLPGSSALAQSTGEWSDLETRVFARAKRLSPREERSLARRIKRGDANALEQLITANMALVLRAVSDFRQCGAPLDDLVQEGNLGLVRAARQFNPRAHSARFATYALYWIRSFIVRALASNGSVIQVPEKAYVLRLRIRRAVRELKALGAVPSGDPTSKPPSLDEVARYLGVPPHRLKRARLSQNEQSIRVRLRDLMLADDPAPDQGFVTNEDRALVHTALRRLSPFEAWVICERYGLGEPTPGRGVGGTPLRPARATEKASNVVSPGQPAAAANDGPRRGEPYYQRSYFDMGRDCGLSVRRLQQVEQTALDKLRGFLSRRTSEAPRGDRPKG